MGNAVAIKLLLLVLVHSGCPGFVHLQKAESDEVGLTGFAVEDGTVTGVTPLITTKEGQAKELERQAHELRHELKQEAECEKTEKKLKQELWGKL